MEWIKNGICASPPLPSIGRATDNRRLGIVQHPIEAPLRLILRLSDRLQAVLGLIQGFGPRSSSRLCGEAFHDFLGIGEGGIPILDGHVDPGAGAEVGDAEHRLLEVAFPFSSTASGS